jgi:hypothetical protein
LNGPRQPLGANIADAIVSQVKIGHDCATATQNLCKGLRANVPDFISKEGQNR